MAAADVLTLPSHAEGMPVSLMEGLAAGVPMVATDVGGTAELVARDPASTLVSVGDTRALAAALTETLSETRCERVSRIPSGSEMDSRSHVSLVLRLAEELSASRR
jgi:glycosyltransferase involved in cell wall biosynthesis